MTTGTGEFGYSCGGQIIATVAAGAIAGEANVVSPQAYPFEQRVLPGAQDQVPQGRLLGRGYALDCSKLA